MGARDRWLAAVQARLERVATEQDLSPVLEEAALTEALELSRTITDDASLLETRHVLGWLEWYRYLAQPDTQDERGLEFILSQFIPCFISGWTNLPAPLLPTLAAETVPIARELLKHAQDSDDLELRSATIRFWQRILSATPAGDPARAGRLSNLGAALVLRFERTESAEDLDAAIEAMRQAVQAAPTDDPDKAAILSNLGSVLERRFQRGAAVEDLDTAIEAMRQAVRATPADHPDRTWHLSNLGKVILARFERAGQLQDLDGLIIIYREIVEAAPKGHPDRAGSLSNVASALHDRFERTGELDDADAAIEAGLEAVHAAATDDRNKAAILSNLAVALHARFARTGQLEDLEAAIRAWRDALQATTVDHTDRATILSNLGGALESLFARTGQLEDLEAAIRAGQQAVDATPSDHPSRSSRLVNLGASLQSRFARIGAASDLDTAVAHYREAVQVAPTDHPDRFKGLSNLANALQFRFERTGATGDLDCAIEAAQQAVQGAPTGHPDRATRLSSLGNALRLRFLRTGATQDLDAAIGAAQEAAQATPTDHPQRAGRLSLLGSGLQAQFEHTGNPGDLNAAIEVAHQAVLAIPADHPDRAAYLSNLGGALYLQFRRTQATADEDTAITFLREAVQAIPHDHPDRAAALSNLGAVLRSRSERTGEAPDLDNAVQLYTEAASLHGAAASTRIDAGRAAARLAARMDPSRAASLLEAAVLLLPEVAPRFLERGDQQQAIGRFAGLAADAAALALSDESAPGADRPERALRLLEAARGVLLSQALSTRGDLSELRKSHPDLAARFLELRDWLDRPSPASGSDLTRLLGDRTAEVSQRAVRDRRHAAAEFTRLLACIRGLQDFSTFGLPPSAEQLEAQAEQGPVVVFNVSAYRSDAILLTSGGIGSRRLPNLDQATLIDNIEAFYNALDTIAIDESPLARVGAQNALRKVLAWLWDTAAEPVLESLGYVQPPSPGQPWTRLWWVPGGLLSLLPIHAAGRFASPPEPGHYTVMDRVISSYTPTVGALAHARSAHSESRAERMSRSLIVAMPTTPDVPDGDLSWVLDEAALLESRLPHPTVLTEPATTHHTSVGQLPTKAAILERLPSCAIAHFACHGHTDPADPSQSRLLLHDHRSDPLTVAALAPIALDHAQLAYLSACSTARVSDARLLDEAIHLASAFHLAGFPHVIGTLWEIDDQAAVDIAKSFYAALTNADGALDSNRAASALHNATRIQRDRQRNAPYFWASHIHTGA